MAAQFTFIKGKEYKVVNWIDGNVYVATFSAAGKESTVRSAVTIAKVMAALVEQAHAEALEIEAARKEARRVAEVVRAEFYLHNPVFQRDFIAAAHDAALEHDALVNSMKGCKAMGEYNARNAAPTLRRADELYAGCRIRTSDGVKTIAAVEADSDNTMLIYLKGEEDNPREAYKHTEIEVIN